MSKDLLAPQSQKIKSLELSIEEIRQVKDELTRTSNDSTQRELYDMRANSLRYKISEFSKRVTSSLSRTPGGFKIFHRQVFI